MIEIERALALLERAAKPMDHETVPLEQSLGRVLAETVVTDRELPPTDRAAMDGFAVRSVDLRDGEAVLAVAGEVRAGVAASGIRVEPGTAVRIMTGAEIPDGADAVAMVERAEEDRDRGTVLLRGRAEPGQHIRRRGQDIARGEALLRPGRPIHAAEIAALASVGHVRVEVFRRPLVRVVSTGDEIVPPEAAPAPHQVRNSNTPTLKIVADTAAALGEAVRRGLEADVFLLTGGVSMGEYDLVGAALRRAGVEILFHKVAVKPGKPILVGTAGDRLVVGLPGNPVSAYTGFHVFVAPYLRRRMGFERFRNERIEAVLEAPLRPRPDRVTYHLARLEWQGGAWRASPSRTTGSGDVVSMVRANGFVISRPGSEIPAGDTVPALLWPRHAER